MQGGFKRLASDVTSAGIGVQSGNAHKDLILARALANATTAVFFACGQLPILAAVFVATLRDLVYLLAAIVAAVWPFALVAEVRALAAAGCWAPPCCKRKPTPPQTCTPGAIQW